jgi:hypothetical protein
MMDGVISLDDRPAIAAVNRANAGMDDHEKKVKTVLDRTGREWQVYGEGLVRVSDRSKNSLDRLLQSMERQSQMAGKSGVDRIIAERDQLIARWSKEDAAVQAITKSYAKLIEAESARGATAGLKEMGDVSGESRASLALLGEEIGVRIPRHVRSFITTMPGVGEALSMGFKTIAVAAVVMVLYEAIKKAVEFRGRLEELRIASERETAELHRFTDGQKLANDEMKVANDRLEVAIAKLEGKPRNELKLAIDEAALAADHLTEKLDKALRSFYEIVQKNAPGTFAQIVGRQPSTTDIQEMVGGKSGYGGMIGEMYKATTAGQDPTQVLAKYRAQAQQLLARSEFAQSFQAGTLALNDPRRQDKSMYPVDSTQQQGPRIEVLNALIHQIDLQAQSYGLERQNNALTAAKAGLEDQGKAAGRKAADTQLREFQRAAAEFERKGDEAELDAIGKIYYQRDLLLKQARELKGVEGDIAAIRLSADSQVGALADKGNQKYLATQLKQAEETAQFMDRMIPKLGGKTQAQVDREALEASDAAARDRVDSIRLQSQKDTLNREAGQAQKMVGLSGLTGTDAIRAAYQIRIDLAKQLAVIEAERIVKEETGAKQIESIARAQAAVQKEMAEAQEEAAMKQLELQKQQMDGLKKESEGMWHTLLTNPRNFGKQLGSTVHEAVIKPVAEGMAGMTANVLKPIIYGADGGGGLAGMFKGVFGGGHADPMKISTDMNTAVTVQNSAALATLTAILAGAMGMAAPAVAMPAGIGGLSLPSISAPAVSGSAASVGGGYSPMIGGDGGFGGGLLTSAGIPTFMGGGAAGRAAGGGFNPLAMVLGGGRSGGGASAPNFAGILKNFKGINWGGFTHGPDVYSTDANGSDIESQGKITGVNGVAGAALFTGGTMLAQQGLLGSSRGTWGGVAEGTLGGAAIGFQMGGPLGAAIGGAVGLGIGLGEKIAGVESPENEAKRLIKSLYSVSIDTAMAKQIVGIAQSKYAGHVSIAVRDPDVRKMLELYAQGTGQKMPLSATTPRGGSLAEQGGNLYQQQSYVNGVGYTFASNLPVMGGPSGGTYPTPGSPNTAAGMGPMSVSLNINGADAQAFIQGQMITPQFVTDQSLSSQNSSYGRVQQSANMQIPGLMVGT